MIIERAADPQAFYGFPNGSVSSFNAGGNGVTDGETSPCRAIKRKSEFQPDQ